MPLLSIPNCALLVNSTHLLAQLWMRHSMMLWRLAKLCRLLRK
jgi:hypothetical protein